MCLNEKLKNLHSNRTIVTQMDSHTDEPDLYRLVINNTNIVFTEGENPLLHNGLKYNLHFKPKSGYTR
jgi:hypothetical protein